MPYIERPFTSIELACAVRQPGPCVHAVCECVALLPSRNMTCVRPRCNATPSEDFRVRQPSPCGRAVCACVALLPSRKKTCVRPPCTAGPIRENFLHTSQCRLHILHFTSHTSSQLNPHFSNFFHTANFYTQKLLHTEAFYTQKLLHRRFYTAALYSQQAFTHSKL